MRKIVAIVILILFNLSLYAQKEINIDNSLTGILIQNKNQSQFNINYTGCNSILYKEHLTLESNTNYQIGGSPEISQNELSQKTNIGYKKNSVDFFITHQFNYSLIRGIDFDNWLGIGTGYKITNKNIKTSISYAFLYQNIKSNEIDYSQTLRHSIRFKLSIDKKLFNITTEYYYQPIIYKFSDYIVYGSTKVILLPQRKVNFTIQDVINYRSIYNYKMIHSVTFGVSYKFSKKS